MRKLFLGVATAYGGNAFAQSQQGGDLGLNPGGHQTATAPAPTHPGSGQGGYLGLHAGAHLAPAPAIDGDVKSAPTAWCRKSPEPSRCRGRAEMDHAQCMAENPDHYESCRFAFDRMWFK